jgi:dTDP-4-dehydrorhamnose 3,5-epimerase
VKLVPTGIQGVMVVEPDRIEDERGFFARTFDASIFEEAGLEPAVVQCNISFNKLAGTLRGLHYQDERAIEAKLVRCSQGAIWDVVVDMRPDSPTRLQHVSVELSAQNRLALYIPPLFAHGFQTLQDDTEVMYQMGHFYEAAAATGLRYDDPALGIEWPLAISSVAPKDLDWQLLKG